MSNFFSYKGATYKVEVIEKTYLKMNLQSDWKYIK